MPSDSRSDSPGSPPFVGSVLDALDRLRRRTAFPPEELCRRACVCLNERLGPSGAPIADSFAYGMTGLLGEQTHYTDGYGFLLPLKQGIAVAIRRAQGKTSQVVVEGESGGETTAGPREEKGTGRLPDRQQIWMRVMEAARQAQGLPPIEGAVVSTVPRACFDASLSALGVATVRALDEEGAGTLPARRARAQEEGKGARAEAREAVVLARSVRNLLSEAAGFPFSLGYPLAAATHRPPDFVLFDTAVAEHLPVEAPPEDTLGWAMVSLGSGPLQGASFHEERRRQAEKALAHLRKEGFEQLQSFRELEHRDLDRAVALLPGPLKPVARHLVTENRRVRKMVVAARHEDWQLFGAHLLMSHASLKEEWGSTTPALDAVVEEAEAMSMEGIHGACMTGRGPCALIAGRPLALPDALDRITGSLEKRFDLRAETMLF